MILHADALGTVHLINGQLVDDLDISTTPSISGEQALQSALQHIGPASYRWNDPNAEAILQEVFEDPQRAWKPQPELEIAPVGRDLSGSDYRLERKVLVAVDAPRPANWVWFVNANSSTRSPSRAFDNSSSSYWRSNGGGTQYLQADLGTGAKSYNQTTIE